MFNFLYIYIIVFIVFQLFEIFLNYHLRSLQIIWDGHTGYGFQS